MARRDLGDQRAPVRRVFAVDPIAAPAAVVRDREVPQDRRAEALGEKFRRPAHLAIVSATRLVVRARRAAYAERPEDAADEGAGAEGEPAEGKVGGEAAERAAHHAAHRAGGRD